MRQTFFHELEEVAKQEKQELEEREKIELYLRKGNKSRTMRDFIPFISIVVVVLLAGVVATYALYLFMNVSRIGNVAGIHMSDVLSLALRSIQGKAYNNPDMGIKNWMVYSDVSNGFIVRYPESWKLDDSSNHLFQIKKYNSQRSINESLSAAAFIENIDHNGSESLESYVLTNEKINGKLPFRKSINGKDFIKIGKVKDESGLIYCKAYWKGKKGVYSFKVIHYNQKNQVTDEEFDKMLSVMEIMN